MKELIERAVYLTGICQKSRNFLPNQTCLKANQRLVVVYSEDDLQTDLYTFQSREIQYGNISRKDRNNFISREHCIVPI